MKRKNPQQKRASRDIQYQNSNGADTLLALEPRIMYDGAAAVVAADAVDAPDPTVESAAEPTQEASFQDLFKDYTPPATDVPKEIIFVDGSVDNYETFAQGLSPESRIIVLDSSRDGIAQIGEALAGYTDLDAVHIVSHGDSGSVELGSSSLSLGNLSEYSSQLQNWGKSLADNGDILFYGCDIASGADGQNLIQAIGGLTQADIAASTDVTGHALLGGDWDLEYVHGAVESAAPLAWNSYAGTLGDVVFIDSTQDIDVGQTEGAALGDFDGDGDLDVFIVNTQDPDRVYFNDGTGTFTDSGQSLGNGTDFGQEVAIGDLDGDGDLDAYVVNAGDADRVYLNNGSGVFTDSGQSLSTASARGVTLGDLDNDGDLDAYVANYGDNQIYKNDGSGTFSLFATLTGSGSSQDVDLADLDGDGYLDAFVANWGNEANEVWYNDTTGDFVLTQTLGSSVSMGVSLGDVDGDGNIDAFVANLDGQPDKVWMNDGTGTATAFSDSGQNLGNSASYGVKLEDVDQDGDLDAFVVGGNFWINDGSGNFSTNGLATGGQEVVFGDLDSDGDEDAFLAIRWGNRMWFNNYVPEVTSGAVMNYTENDAPTVIDPGITLYDFDNTTFAGAVIQIITNYAEGEDQLSFTPVGGITGVWDAPSATLTLSGIGTGTEYAAALASVRYENISDNPSVLPRTVSFSLNDSMATSINPGLATINITATNDAPVLIPSPPDFEEVVTHEMIANGERISDIIAGSITDVDQNPLFGIAVTSVDNTFGDWQYSFDDGSNWTAFGTVSDTFATLLAADSGTRIRFVPDSPDLVGLTTIEYRAWDQINGLPNGTVGEDVSINGGNTPYSLVTEVSKVKIVISLESTTATTTTDTTETLPPPPLTTDTSTPVITDSTPNDTAFDAAPDGEISSLESVISEQVAPESVIDTAFFDAPSDDALAAEGDIILDDQPLEESTEEEAEEPAEEEAAEEEGEEEAEEESEEETEDEEAAEEEFTGDAVAALAAGAAVEGQPTDGQQAEGQKGLAEQLAQKKQVSEAERAEILKVFGDVFDLLQCK